jgi:hypothetical protein
VVIGIQNFVTKETQIFRAANTELALFVIDDPYAEFEVQVNGTIAVTDIGKEANLIVAAGDDTIGISRIQLDVTSLITSGGQVKILGLAERDDNVMGTYSKVRVVIVKHSYNRFSGNNYWTDGVTSLYPADTKDIESKQNILLPRTTATVGQIKFNGDTYFHIYGPDNIFIGAGAGNYTTWGMVNLAVGLNSLHSATTASYNTFFGYHGGQNLTAADQNTGIGAAVFPNLITGKYNLGAGYAAGIAYTGAESYNLLLYSNGVTGENNTIRIGTHGSGAGQQNRTFVAGIYGITTAGATPKTVVIGDNYQFGTVDYPVTTITNSITAHAGGGQADATSLTTATNVVTICVSNNDSVKLNPTTPCIGLIMRVVNTTDKICDVYPIPGSTMDGILNAVYSIPIYSTRDFQMISTTGWVRITYS